MYVYIYSPDMDIYTKVYSDNNSVGCQSVNIYVCANEGLLYSKMICILHKIQRLRKHPWISAQTMDP